MKDERLYAKFTLDFPTNPKIKPLSDGAFRCLFEAILWSRQHLTDGFLPRRLALASWCFEVLQELCTNDDANPSLSETPEGWWIHDFTEHQTTKAEITERREAKVRAGQKGGLASGRSRREAKLKQARSKTKPETETETHTEVTTNVVTSATPKRKSPRTPIPDGFRPSPVSLDKILGEFRGVTDDDLGYQHRKFTDHAIQNNRLCAGERGWNAAWCNWMRTADERNELRRRGRTGVARSTSDERFAQAQALKLVVPDDRMELE